MARLLTDETWHRTRGGIPKQVLEQRTPGWMLKVTVDPKRKDERDGGDTSGPRARKASGGSASGRDWERVPTKASATTRNLLRPRFRQGALGSVESFEDEQNLRPANERVRSCSATHGWMSEHPASRSR